MTTNKKRKTKVQYTKVAMTWILVVALLDIQIPYVLAFFGKENTLEDLAKTIVIEIVGVFLVYCVKSFFETREEKKNKKEEENDETEIDE